jgi:membrane-bound inhibitor of C-type lysozyme
MNNKYSINLLQAELLPKQVLLTLKRVVISWLLVSSLMLVMAFFSQYQANNVAEQLKALNKVKVKQNKVLADLEKNIQQNKTDVKLTRELKTLKFVMSNKQALYQELTNRDTTYVGGFAKAMTDLSEMHSKNISLQKVFIDSEQLTFSGVASTPGAVPAWLALFESSSILSGKVFSDFSLNNGINNGNNVIQFVVSTTNQGISVY